MKIVTAEEMARLDRRAIEEFGIPGDILMERAGQGVAAYVRDALSRWRLARRVLLLAGRGNNGGDAFVVARVLHKEGIRTLTALLGRARDLRGDARMNCERAMRAGCNVVEATSECAWPFASGFGSEAGLVVDGIFGTGFEGEMHGLPALVVGHVNRLGIPVVAIDIPSGISGTRGFTKGICIRARATVTMGLPKEGLFLGEAPNCVGELRIVDIGLPHEVVAEADSRAEWVSAADVAAVLPSRHVVSHKGNYGRVFVLAGSRGFTGAAALACDAAVRGGAGLVYLGIPESLNAILEQKVTEPITVPLPDGGEGFLKTEALPRALECVRACEVTVVGPGIGTHPETKAVVEAVLATAEGTVVIDADGLNCLDMTKGSLRHCRARVMVTPHPGEMARLLGKTVAEIQADRWETARRFSREHHVVTVLKGTGTVIADEVGPVWVNSTGNPGMASGGMGDVLTGLIGALAGQGLRAVDAARAGAYLHGLAADRVAERRGQVGLRATDLLAELPATIRETQQTGREKALARRSGRGYLV